jgi:glutathione S-transferase
MTLVLYELCGADDQRFSPFCWRTRTALMHKGLEFQTVPVGFTEKDKIAFSGQDKVPVIVDDGTVVCDSWAIAEYLEDTYPDKPSLFPGDRGRAYAKMTNDWTDKLNPLILKSIIGDVFSRLDPADHDYFRGTREQRFGKSLEDVQAEREVTRGQLRDAMASMRAHLMDGPFVSGEAPAYSDYIVFGSLRWAALCSEFAMLEEDDPVQQWYRRVAKTLNVD